MPDLHCSRPSDTSNALRAGHQADEEKKQDLLCKNMMGKPVNHACRGNMHVQCWQAETLGPSLAGAVCSALDKCCVGCRAQDRRWRSRSACFARIRWATALRLPQHHVVPYRRQTLLDLTTWVLLQGKHLSLLLGAGYQADDGEEGGPVPQEHDGQACQLCLPQRHFTRPLPGHGRDWRPPLLRHEPVLS